jgi:acetyltransferase-like isoleucine patch superfamily enzyme
LQVVGQKRRSNFLPKTSDLKPPTIISSPITSNLKPQTYNVPREKTMEFQSIAPDVKLGKNVKIHKFVNLYGCEVDDNTKIGCFVEIQKNARVGKHCKISSHTFICEGVIIEDNVFIGHNVTFINDKYPRSTNNNGELQTEEDWKVDPIIVKKGASIGSGATILCNVTIGENAIVGAGSVVTKDVPPNTIVVGNPARIFRDIESLPQFEKAEMQRVLFEFMKNRQYEL